MRGLRLDRLLLTTDTTFLPTGFGPTETDRLATGRPGVMIPLAHTIVYTYDHLYRLTEANSYSSGENYTYACDPAGNRLRQIINTLSGTGGDTTEYLYDAANHLASVNGQSYTFDDSGNLLTTGVMTNTWLIQTQRISSTLQPIYNGLGDRVGQTIGVTTTHFVLDVQGPPEVIYTSQDERFLHLPGVVMAENAKGKVASCWAMGWAVSSRRWMGPGR